MLSVLVHYFVKNKGHPEVGSLLLAQIDSDTLHKGSQSSIQMSLKNKP